MVYEVFIEKIYTPPGFQINKNDIVVDIGANIGIFALYASQPSPIYCYEPFGENVSFLKKNMKQNGKKNVKIFQAAVSDGVGEEQLFWKVPRKLNIYSLVK